ncbi:MAG: sigma-70 family RNA polymerase sigma factor [Myxococcales bacterium]
MATDVLSVDLGAPGLAAEGHGSALKLEVAAIYDAHSDYVFRCLRSLGVAPSALEDAVQDVFVVVQQKLSEFDGACALRTWLYAIVIRIARKKRAALARSWSASSWDVGAESAGAECTEHEAARQEGLALAQRALGALDAEKREVFVLLEIEQMSAPEVAQILGVPVNTVYSRLRLARLAFDREVERLTRVKGQSQRGRHG